MTLFTGIAEALRRADLTVVEEPGWRARGRDDFNPQGVVFHHTASRQGADAPSLGIVIAGRSDLPGPLCHVLISRSSVCHVIASGTANHAGPGGWKGLTHNRDVFGIEVENDGVGEEWPDTILDATARASKALLDMVRRDASWLCGHKEWAPRRKIDPARINMDQFRARVANLGDDDMTPAELQAALDKQNTWTRQELNKYHAETRRVIIDAIADPAEFAAQVSTALTGAGTTITPAMLESALRKVLGSLDET